MSAINLKKVLISDAVDPTAVDILRRGNIQADIQTGLSKDQLIEKIKDYDALVVRSATTVTADVIEAALNLKIIGRAGVGVDNIDCEAATKNGVIVINAPGGNTISAAELTCTMILSVSRHIVAASSSLKSGVWDRKSYMGNELVGKTLAIIGLGRIGREVAHRMQSFGMKTIGFDPLVPADVSETFGVKSYPLEQIWPLADYITVHTPLIPQTKYLLNDSTLSKCKKGVRLINVARGGIIEEEALLKALQSGQVGGAGLDVFEEEPPKRNQLLAHPKVICTPHLGASTKEAQQNVAIEIANQFLDIIDGKPVPGVVNAPLLSEMLKPENTPFTRLAESLGKLAFVLSPQANQFNVTISGQSLAKLSKLIQASVVVGLVKARKRSESANLISAPGLAKALGLSTNVQVVDGEESISVSHGDASVVGVNHGQNSYLSSVSNQKLSPTVELKGHLTVFTTKSSIDKVLGALVQQRVTVRSITSSGNFYALHSSGPIENKPNGLEADVWAHFNL